MATKEVMDDQESCNIDLGSPKNAQTISARRLKKREVDRRCQREARERKRSRVTYLESLVEDLKQQDTSGQVAALLKQLQKTEEERDGVLKTLKDIQHIMVQRPLKLSEDQAQDTGTAKAHVISEDANSRSEFTESTTEAYTSLPINTRSPLLGIDAIPASISELFSSIPVPDGESDQYNMSSSPGVVQRISPHPTDQALSQSRRAGVQHTTASSMKYDWVNPRSSCSCHGHLDRQPGQHAVWQGNFWKFVSEVLSERLDWAEDVQPAEDVDSEDVPIRALLQGWDAVAKRTAQHPSWQMLRRIDEALFRPIPKTERLAMLRAMHLLIQFHTEPSAERYKRLPPWYLYRPSQHITHTYAIDYYAWPHFRQRFIFNEHAYCGNDFWHMYQNEMRLLWPFEFRDCYTHDLETDLYKPSRLFDERINDIKCWTMGPDFFQRFPELSSDIPASFRKIPKSLPSAICQMGTQSRLPSYAAPAKGVQLTSMKVVEEGETQRQEQEQEQVKLIDLQAATSSHTFTNHGVGPQINLNQSYNEQASALLLEPHGYSCQLQTSDPLSSFPSYGRSDFWDFAFDPSPISINTVDPSTLPFTAGAAVL
ncbi:hypothetical protein N0V90_010900 [Kalmusia sp. IMI 367209]|nr:hypothetical protein N0V90_010900 [Kalmusia sp. IMI 367209]